MYEFNAYDVFNAFIELWLAGWPASQNWSHLWETQLRGFDEFWLAGEPASQNSATVTTD